MLNEKKLKFDLWPNLVCDTPPCPNAYTCMYQVSWR